MQRLAPLQLLVGLGQLLLSLAQLFQGAQQLLVLLLHLLEGVLRPPGGPAPRRPAPGRVAVTARRRLGRALPSIDRRARAGRGVDLKRVHQPAGADDAQPHARWATVPPVEDGLQVLDARPAVADADHERLAGLSPSTRNSTLPPPGVLEGVAGDLGDGGGDARLVLGVEAQQPGDLPGSLAGQHHVLLQADLQAEDGLLMLPPSAASRAARTVTSSRPR